VVAWREKSKDQTDRPEHKKRWFDYMAVLLKNEDGSVASVVADSLEQGNALYLWRADTSDYADWIDVFSGDKASARREKQARRFLHIGDLEERVVHYLTLPQEQFLDEVTRPPRSK